MLRNLLILLLISPAAQAWYVTPRVGVGFAVAHRSDEWRLSNVPVNLGVALQPSGSRMLAGFVSPQLDLEFPAEGEGISYVPTLRVGLVIRDDEPEYFSALASWAQLYLIVGWRLPNGPEAPGTRLGIGISSPIGLALSLEAMQAGVPLPNTFEFVVDGLENPVSVFRFGFAL